MQIAKSVTKMFARLKKLSSTVRWTPRTVICVIVLVFVPGGIFITPLLMGRRLKRGSQSMPVASDSGRD